MKVRLGIILAIHCHYHTCVNLCPIKNKWIKWLLYIILSVLYDMVIYLIVAFCGNAYFYGVFNYKALSRLFSDPLTYFILSLFTGVWLQFLLLACLYESFLIRPRLIIARD